MKRVTRDIDPQGARDLLERVPRACISFVCADGPQAQPIALLFQEGRYLVGLSASAGQWPGTGQEIVVLVDEGVHWFDLRGISIRGLAKPASAPASAPGGRRWFEVVPERTAAWDYGMLRAVGDDT